jgi:hypothetical protein
MSDASTVRMLSRLEVLARAPLFLSSYFRSPPENYFNSEKVEIDVIREDEDVAVPVPDVTTDARHNEANKWVNKAFTPAIFNEKTAIVAWEQLKRQPGQDPFKNPNFLQSAGEQAQQFLGKCLRKVRRSVELMSSQVFQTGAISMVDSTGAVIYAENFLPKAAHMATVSTAWAVNGSTGDPLADLGALAVTVRKNGKRKPDRLLMGSSARQRFLANANVQKALDKTVLNLGSLNPADRSEDSTYLGNVWIDNYLFEMWGYEGYYKHPQTGTITPYIGPDNVIMASSTARLDLAFGALPTFITAQNNVVDFLNGRMALPSSQIDLQVVSYLAPNGRQLFIECACRAIPIPSELDSFARLDVTP